LEVKKETFNALMKLYSEKERGDKVTGDDAPQ
jgi:hypothetical protein